MGDDYARILFPPDDRPRREASRARNNLLPLSAFIVERPRLALDVEGCRRQGGRSRCWIARRRFVKPRTRRDTAVAADVSRSRMDGYGLDAGCADCSSATSLLAHIRSCSSKSTPGTTTISLSTANQSSVRSEFASKDLKSVGTYTLGRLIGKGSFGKVYLATHKLTNGSKVRVKALDTPVIPD